MEFRWVALEVTSVSRAAAFYESTLDLTPTIDRDDAVCLPLGGHELWLHHPDIVPRGGVHTHFALSTTSAGYAEWYERLDARLSVSEHDFGSFRSLYFDDPACHCVELAGVADGASTEITGVFEVALEVSSLERATSRYEALGFKVVDRGTDRRRVRLRGPIDLELWEPQIGLADARGGEHVALGFAVDAPSTLAGSVVEHFESVVPVDGGVRLTDPDGHTVTLLDDQSPSR